MVPSDDATMLSVYDPKRASGRHLVSGLVLVSFLAPSLYQHCEACQSFIGLFVALVPGVGGVWALCHDLVRGIRAPGFYHAYLSTPRGRLLGLSMLLLWLLFLGVALLVFLLGMTLFLGWKAFNMSDHFPFWVLPCLAVGALAVFATAWVWFPPTKEELARRGAEGNAKAGDNGDEEEQLLPMRENQDDDNEPEMDLMASSSTIKPNTDLLFSTQANRQTTIMISDVT